MLRRWIGLGFFALTQSMTRWRPGLWRWWYNLLASKDPHGQLLFMNYGYAGDPGAPALVLHQNDEAHRLPIQLYDHVVSGVTLQDRNIVEVGCGRGGGGSFLLRYRAPRHYIGIDLSESAIRWCRQQSPQSNAHWLVGRADALPLPDRCADVVLNVESSHCYPSFANFLEEVFRVLRPGGYFAFCDLRGAQGRREIENRFHAQGGTICEARDITPAVLRALDHVSAERAQRIAHNVPVLLRPTFRDFAGIKDTAVYERLARGDLVYFSYLVRKPPA